MKTQTPTLICLTYAGGNGHSYNSLESLLSSSMTVYQHELPGRGRRSAEPLLQSIEDVVDDVLHYTESMRQGAYALFGHSMGAVVSYRLCCRLRSMGMPLPGHVFASGCAAPHALSVHKNRALLPSDEFFSMLVDVDSDKASPFDHEEFRSYIEPILRADFHVVDTYEHQQEELLPIPIRVLMGTHDAVSQHQVTKWQDVTSEPIALFTFEGGHFFIDKHAGLIARIIRENVCHSGLKATSCHQQPSPSIQ